MCEDSDNCCYCDFWKNDNYKENNLEEKQRNYTKIEANRIKSDSFVRNNQNMYNRSISFKVLF